MGPMPEEEDVPLNDEEVGVEEEEEEEVVTNQYRDLAYKAFLVAVALLVVIYLLAAFIIDFQRAIALFTMTALVLAYHVWVLFANSNAELIERGEASLIEFLNKTDTEWKYGVGMASSLILIMGIIIATTVKDGRNMISLLGLFVFIGLTWMFSWNPSKVKIRPVLGGVFMQFIFGYIVIKTSWGLAAIEFLSDTFLTLLGFTTAGSSFVYDWLTDGSLFGRAFQMADGSSYILGPPFFFNVLPTVVFFSSLMSVGYYLRVLPWLVRKVGYFLAILLGTSASESLSAAGNIFLGQTEAPLLVKVCTNLVNCRSHP
jgi:hypothetical protein